MELGVGGLAPSSRANRPESPYSSLILIIYLRLILVAERDYRGDERIGAEESEPLSGSTNARLCLAGRFTQSFNRAQSFIHKTCVTRTLVFLILQAQQRRRMNGDQDTQSVYGIEGYAAIALNGDHSSHQTLRRRCSEGDDEPLGANRARR